MCQTGHKKAENWKPRQAGFTSLLVRSRKMVKYTQKRQPYSAHLEQNRTRSVHEQSKSSQRSAENTRNQAANKQHLSLLRGEGFTAVPSQMNLFERVLAAQGVYEWHSNEQWSGCDWYLIAEDLVYKRFQWSQWNYSRTRSTIDDS